MFFLHMNESAATNLDNVNRIAVNGKYITAYMVDGSNHPIARFDSAEEAEDEFVKVFARVRRET